MHLGDVPCDFLAWEHMSWECSHFDRGLDGMVGLALTAPPTVGGAPVRMLLVPTGLGGQERRVAWHHVRAGHALQLRWAVPDGHFGAAAVTVLVDGRTVDHFEVPLRGDGRVHARAVDTSPFAGRRVDLELRVLSTRRMTSTVLLDGTLR